MSCAKKRNSMGNILQSYTVKPIKFYTQYCSCSSVYIHTLPVYTHIYTYIKFQRIFPMEVFKYIYKPIQAN